MLPFVIAGGLGVLAAASAYEQHSRRREESSDIRPYRIGVGRSGDEGAYTHAADPPYVLPDPREGPSTGFAQMGRHGVPDRIEAPISPVAIQQSELFIFQSGMQSLDPHTVARHAYYFEVVGLLPEARVLRQREAQLRASGINPDPGNPYGR